MMSVLSNGIIFIIVVVVCSMFWCRRKMARSSSGRAKLEGMQRRTKSANPAYLSPRKSGNRLQEELKKSNVKKSRQSHKKR